MSFQNQVLAISLCYLLSLIYLRGFIYGVKRHMLNNSAYKKRKKGETFREWLFYTRYKEEIPLKLRLFFYVVLIIHPLCCVVCLFVYMASLPQNISQVLTKFIYYFDAIWILIFSLLFWSPGHDYEYGRWIKKTRGMNRKKK